MILWVIFAVLTAAVLAVLLWPLYRGSASVLGRAEYDIQVYRDQLSELERDAAAGLINRADADAARNELSRRILQAGRAETPETAPSRTPVKAAMALALAGIPAASLAIYLSNGRPDLPDLPRETRVANAVKNSDIYGMIAKARAHLEKNPKDVRGWLVLAVTYRRLQEFEQAAAHFERALALTTPTASLLTEYAEMIVLANKGMVNRTARKSFDEALTLNAAEIVDLRNRHRQAVATGNQQQQAKLERDIAAAVSGYAKVRFYRALADSQEGKKKEALAEFKRILADSPDNAPWRAAVNRQIARLEPPVSAPKIDKDTIQAAGSMSVAERQEMIRGMVQRLAGRLAEEGGDIDSWLRLANARSVLGEKDKAAEALNTAAKQFKNDETALARIQRTRERLGLTN